jgi:UDP-GlcNAc:undecaprenyl-phosphate/decaprenyl-phosphate GlcNAc-1-phosphate transferase
VTLLYLGVFAVSLLCSFFFTRGVRNLANARGWIVEPNLDRHLHCTPVPQLGGVAIFLAFLLATLVVLLIRWVHPQLGLDFSLQTPLVILAAGVLILLLGVYDDFRTVGPYFKFTVQAAAGCILFAGGLRIHDLPLLFGQRNLPWFVGLPLTILWVLAITNAFNLIDGLDGLAAGSALFSTIVVLAVSSLSHNWLVSLMTLALAGAILGFLRYNFNPATIFLGDSGSLFIGFMLSALALQGAEKSPTILAVAIPVVSFGLPILETALSVLRRWMSGRSLFSADREHIHHKLLERGLSQRQVVIILYAVSAMFALCSLFLLWPSGSTLGIVFVVLGSGVWIGVQHLGYVELGELSRFAQRALKQRQIFISDLSIRRAIEQLKAARDFEDLCRILIAAFTASDFDAFELQLHTMPHRLPAIHGLRVMVQADGRPYLRWQKAKGNARGRQESGWRLSLELVSANQRHRTAMAVCRSYTERALQLDVNLLTSEFPVVLADALHRTLTDASPAKPTVKEAIEPTIVPQAG